jgi:transposase InsO family protein
MNASRLAYTELLADERKHCATAFLARRLAWFTRHGVTVGRVMTDNGSAYRSRHFADAVATAGLRHIRTRLYAAHQRQAERFIQSSPREWTYARPFHSSAERAPPCCLGAINTITADLTHPRQ